MRISNFKSYDKDIDINPENASIWNNRASTNIKVILNKIIELIKNEK